jgi:hypothetical protein
VLQTISHPVNNASLPSFVHPALADASAELQVVRDCWELLRNGKGPYLPKETKEPAKAYENRLLRSSYPSFFRDAIVAYAGALSRFELRDAPSLIVQNQSSIDADGNSLKAYWMTADAMTLRDGGGLLMVDMPSGRSGDRGQEVASGRRPYLAHAVRSNVVNWRTEKREGIELPVAVSVLEWAEEELGEYGVIIKPRYRVMVRGEWKVIEFKDTDSGPVPQIAKDENGEDLAGTFTDYRNQPMENPPVVWYSGSRSGFGRGDLPLLSLANLTLDWFREYSDLKELLHKTAMPVPVRKGMYGTGPGGTTPAMILGPNSGLDLPENGSFNFAEVAGSSLAQHVEHLVHIEKLIDRQTMNFLLSGSTEKTATQSLLESAQLQASLTSMAEGKSSAMESLFRIWGQFTGEMVPNGAGIDLDSEVFDRPVTAATLDTAERLYNSNLLTRQTVVELAARVGVLPPNRTVKDEVKALEKEDARREASRPAVPGTDEIAGLMGLEGALPAEVMA